MNAATGPAAGGEPTPDPAIVALSRAVERALRRLETVDKNVLQLAAEVAAFSTHDRAATEVPAGCEDGPPAVRSWLLAADAEQAAADLADLVEWVARVYVRFPRAQLSSCWLWHPDVIEELWWLRRAHADAYDPKGGSWMRVGDWHDRQRTGVERRVNAVLGTCGLSRHVDRNGRPADVTEPVDPPLGRHHAAVAAFWTATHTAGPTPSEDLIREADEHDLPSRTNR